MSYLLNDFNIILLTVNSSIIQMGSTPCPEKNETDSTSGMNFKSSRAVIICLMTDSLLITVLQDRRRRSAEHPH